MSSNRTVRRSFTPDEANLLMDVISDRLELLSYRIGDGFLDNDAVAEAESETAKLKALLAHMGARK